MLRWIFFCLTSLNNFKLPFFYVFLKDYCVVYCNWYQNATQQTIIPVYRTVIIVHFSLRHRGRFYQNDLTQFLTQNLDVHPWICHFCDWHHLKLMKVSSTNSANIPYSLECNPHSFYSFRGLKKQMRIRIVCGLDLRLWAGFWKNDRAAVRAVKTIRYKINYFIYYL